MLLQTVLEKKDFKKNEFLLREGQVCQSLFFINRGYCKSYYNLDGMVKNTAFYFENDIATNIASFGSGHRSEFNIVACEPMTVTIFDKRALAEATKQSHEIEAVGRSCIRVFAARQEEFSTLFKLYAASERLEYIEKKHPHMLQRISLSQLASFLGVTRETLSRIRRRRTKS